MSVCTQCGLFEHFYSCPAKRARCVNCRRFGHFARCCPNEPKTSKHKSPSKILRDKERKRQYLCSIMKVRTVFSDLTNVLPIQINSKSSQEIPKIEVVESDIKLNIVQEAVKDQEFSTIVHCDDEIERSAVIDKENRTDSKTSPVKVESLTYIPSTVESYPCKAAKVCLSNSSKIPIPIKTNHHAKCINSSNLSFRKNNVRSNTRVNKCKTPIKKNTIQTTMDAKKNDSASINNSTPAARKHPKSQIYLPISKMLRARKNRDSEVEVLVVYVGDTMAWVKLDNLNCAAKSKFDKLKNKIVMSGISNFRHRTF